MLAFKINSTRYRKLEKILLGAVILPGTSHHEQDGRRKLVLKGLRALRPGARRRRRRPDSLSAFLFVLGLVFFGEGTTGPGDCSAGAGIRSSERTGDLEVG